MAPPAKKAIIVKWAQKVYVSIHDFLKYRVRMSTRNVLVIGGSSPLGSQVVDAFRGNWRVVNLDREENGLVMDNILWSNENIEQEIKGLNVKFDSIICVPHQREEEGGLSEQFMRDRDEILKPAILAGQLAQKYSANNSILIMVGCEDSFDNQIQKAQDNLLSYSSMMNSLHMIGLNLNADDENMPSDLTITTALNNLPNRPVLLDHHQLHQQTQLAAILRLWSDGYSRPHSNSIAKFLDSDQNRLYWQFI